LWKSLYQSLMNCFTFAFTLWGTSSSKGTPLIGCNCDLCRSTDFRDKRLRTSAWLHNGNVSIIFNCGPDFRQQCLTYNIKNVSSILFTHKHFDHIGGIEDMVHFAQHLYVNL
jgi:phosphoribosyl 1,2-cyclic phosphate phosphodiesterase